MSLYYIGFWKGVLHHPKKIIFFLFFQTHHSVPVAGILILRPGLLVMASFTECLPVPPIPEQGLIPTMGNDVIHHSSLAVPSLFLAFHTERMCGEVLARCFLPCPAISPASCGSNLFWMQSLVFLTVLGTGFHKLGAAWMPAGHLAPIRHHPHLR